MKYDFDIIVLIYRHWAIMAPGDNWFDIIALGKCEVPYTKGQYSFCTTPGAGSIIAPGHSFNKHDRGSL